MGDSLFDQLKKSGLAKKSQVHKARTEKHQQVKDQRQKKDKPVDETAQADTKDQPGRTETTVFCSDTDSPHRLPPTFLIRQGLTMRV